MPTSRRSPPPTRPLSPAPWRTSRASARWPPPRRSPGRITSSPRGGMWASRSRPTTASPSRKRWPASPPSCPICSQSPTSLRTRSKNNWGRLGMKYKLGDICTKIGSGATPRGGKDAYCNEGITLVRIQNVLDFSFSDNGLAFINEEQAARLNNVEVLSGDILLNITGDSVARACMMEDSFLPARLNQHVAIIRGKKDVV